MKALVLGGGSVRCAWQAGAIKAVFQKGFVPDRIIGISGGAMNTAFLVTHLILFPSFHSPYFSTP